ncbi:hypothetical protein [uncultured Clostridium sp.]|uniref:hypothetical protein n=1 Tax=uncultured Clostridium sp. TaxID=59620 RepID=UPI0025FF34BE|nr:hypothetical protein [uncultured Clostridium sp.]
MIDNQERFIKRNENGNLTGIVKCPLCSEKFKFESDGIITDVIINTPLGVSGGSHSKSKANTTITNEVISTCPHCNRRFKHYVKEIK